MMKKSIRAAAAVLIVTAALAGCVSYPSQLNLDPSRFENDSVRLEWAVGISFFELKINNLTDQQLDLDLANSAIVSVDGEARPLSRMLRADAQMIPPRAYIVMSSSQGAIFGTDILGRFNSESNEKYPVSLDSSTNDRLYLKSHSGETLRMYLTATVKGRKVVYDIPFRIIGATRVQQGAEEQAPVKPKA
jgi:hypothetical protein